MVNSDSSVRMLSPPLSPYPDLASFGGSLKLRESSQGSAFSKSGAHNHETSFHGGAKQLIDKNAALNSAAVSVTADLASTINTTDSSSEASAAAAAAAGIANVALQKRKMVTCWDSILASPAKFYKAERSFLDLYPVHRSTWSNYLYVETASETRLRRRPRQRVRRMLSEMVMSNSDTASTRTRPASTGNNDRLAQFDRSSDDETASASVAKPRAPKKRASTASPVRVHDLNLSQIEDYSPPLRTLPPGRSLRAEWKGAPMDLSQDPDVHLLHPAEVHLASVLRLPAEVYLDSKRRLFAEKVHRLRQGLPFRRTDSQKACRIDVNKASRLFGAFEKVGWLEDSLFTKYL